MNDEILVKDYETARDTATGIKSDGDAIMEIFRTIDNYMKVLYGETWQSSGADVSNGKYAELRSNYETFYGKINEMHKHINEITGRDQASDTQVGASLS